MNLSRWVWLAWMASVGCAAGRDSGDAGAGEALSGRGGAGGDAQPVGAGRGGAGTGATVALTGGMGARAGTSGAGLAGASGAAGASATAGASGAPAGGAGSGGANLAGAGAPATGCSAPGLLFCDDFESGSTPGMPPAKFTLALNGLGTVAVDATTPAHSGARSVHISSANGYQTFFALTGAPVFPASGALYLRLYIRLGAAMSTGHNTYYKAGAAGMPSSDHETRVGVMNAMLMINQPAGDRGFLSNEKYYTEGNKPGVVFTPMTWTCVEALFDPPHSTFEIWVDGKEVPDLHRTDWQQDPLGSFHFGFEKYAGPDVDIWYDDIAVSTQPIGC